MMKIPNPTRISNARSLRVGWSMHEIPTSASNENPKIAEIGESMKWKKQWWWWYLYWNPGSRAHKFGQYAGNWPAELEIELEDTEKEKEEKRWSWDFLGKQTENLPGKMNGRESGWTNTRGFQNWRKRRENGMNSLFVWNGEDWIN